MTAVTVHSHLAPDTRVRALAADVRRGLTSAPKELPPKWFYDETGSELFERITRLPEYYPTRCERAILRARAGEIAVRTRADTLVELGSGTSEKTRLLLTALTEVGTLRRYMPFDVDAATLERAGRAVCAEYPTVTVEAVAGDFDRHLGLLPRDGCRLVAFLGGTIGNLRPPARHRFLSALRAGMSEGDALLLGTDLLKDADRLRRAYDDAAGVTAAFNRNVLQVINNELGGNFDLAAFEHLAVVNHDQQWVEMRLRATRDMVVPVRALDLEVHFRAGEQMLTEISAKFRPEGVRAELAAAGLSMASWWTDADGDYALSLSGVAS